MKRWIIEALVALALLPWLAGPARAAVDGATAETLMRDSGLWVHLGELHHSVRQGFLAAAARGGPSAPSAEELAAIGALIDSAYDPDRLRTSVRAALAQQLDAELVGRLEDWLRGPVGRALTALEERASRSGVDGETLMKTGMAAFGQATPERQRLLQQLAIETQAAEQMTRMMMQTAIGIQRGVQRAMPERPGPPPEQMRAELEKQRTAMMLAFGPAAVALNAGMYADASDAQLQDYLAFAATPAGRRYTALVLDAVDQAMRDAAETLGNGLVQVRPGAST